MIYAFVEYPLSIHQCVCSKKCSRYWSGAGVRLGRQNACAVIFDQNCCKVFIFLPFFKKTGHLNPHSPHHLYFLPKLLWHVSKKSSNNINSINFAICDQKYITIILPSKESSGNYVIRKNEQGKLCGLRFLRKLFSDISLNSLSSGQVWIHFPVAKGLVWKTMSRQDDFLT